MWTYNVTCALLRIHILLWLKLQDTPVYILLFPSGGQQATVFFHPWALAGERCPQDPALGACRPPESLDQFPLDLSSWLIEKLPVSDPSCTEQIFFKTSFQLKFKRKSIRFCPGLLRTKRPFSFSWKCIENQSDSSLSCPERFSLDFQSLSIEVQ